MYESDFLHIFVILFIIFKNSSSNGNISYNFNTQRLAICTWHIFHLNDFYKVHFFQNAFVSPSNHKHILPLIYETQKMLRLWNI